MAVPEAAGGLVGLAEELLVLEREALDDEGRGELEEDGLVVLDDTEELEVDPEWSALINSAARSDCIVSIANGKISTKDIPIHRGRS